MEELLNTIKNTDYKQYLNIIDNIEAKHITTEIDTYNDALRAILSNKHFNQYIEQNVLSKMPDPNLNEKIIYTELQQFAIDLAFLFIAEYKQQHEEE